MAYTIKLAKEAVGRGANAMDYARTVSDNWALREMIAASGQLVNSVHNLTVDASPQKLMAEHQSRLNEISDALIHAQGTPTMEDAVSTAIKASEAAWKGVAAPGIPTGIQAIDELTGPWEPGQQIIIGGGTKMGKTALALQVSVGLSAIGPVWMYSGEMSQTQMARREIARRTGIPVWRQREGKLNERDFERMVGAQIEVSALPIFIEERRLTIEQIRAAARETQRKHGLAAVVIDHVGLVRWEGTMARKDEWQLSQLVTQEAKAIAKELDVVVVSLVQLKKNTMATTRSATFKERLRAAINHRPTYTDLMGAVERDADHVLIPLNVRPLIASLEPEKESDDYLVWQDRMREYEHRAQIILALSREQEFPASRDVYWDGPTTSFHPLPSERRML